MYRVLLVDDEYMITEGLKVLIPFEKWKMEVVATANDAETALAYIKDNPVDLVITDVNMPGMNGLQMIEQMKTSLPNAAFIILSGYQEFEYVKTALNLQVADYLVKPVNKVELAAILEKLSQQFDQSSHHQMEAILKEKSVSDIVEMTEKINVVVSSLGGMQEHSTILKSGLLTPEKFESLKSKGAVGDMLMHFMDEDGNLVDDEIEDRIISTKLDKLKNYDYIIVAAGGDAKLPIIHTAITHGFVNVLITDENTAELLLGDCTWKKEENTY